MRKRRNSTTPVVEHKHRRSAGATVAPMRTGSARRRRARSCDPEIFKLLIRRCDLDVRRTVFIDDSADNVATADRLGFSTIHFNEATTDLRTEFLRLGLPAEVITEKR